MAKAVVNGAILKCTFGAITSNLSGASGLFSIGGATVATIEDHAASNLGTFGVCAFDQRPCIPACSTPWLGSASIRTGAPLLSSRAKEVCDRAGVISIVDPGQTTMNVGVATELELLAEMYPWVFRTMTPEEVAAAIAARKAALHANGLDPNDTLFFDTLRTIATVLAHRELIDKMARRYGIPPALLAGVVASEMNFDDSIWKDAPLDWLGRHFHLPGPGQGVGSVHEATLKAATEYLYEHDLPGAAEALHRFKLHLFDPGSSARFPNSVEEAAIAASMYHHAHGGTSTPTDMAVVWGGYRAGVDGVSPGGGGGYSAHGFRQNVAKDDPRAQGPLKVGTNAYMSEPMFEYFQGVFP